jgi:hypothetical protein
LLAGVLPAQLGVQDGKGGRCRLGAGKCGYEAACRRLSRQAAEPSTTPLCQRIQLVQPLPQRRAVRVCRQFGLKFDQRKRLTGAWHGSAIPPCARWLCCPPASKKWGNAAGRCK